MKYRVKHHLHLDGKQFDPGDKVELSAEEAALCGSALEAVDGGEEAGSKRSRAKREE